ncbi:MAG: DUF1631 family protein [Betaproteobacteria bacterium]
MKPNPLHRLPAPLEAAIERLKLTVREASERTVESLGLAALAVQNALQRDALLTAQYELNRRSAMLVLRFNESLDERVLRDLGAADGSSTAPPPTAWDTLSLVEDREVEAQITADRFALEVAHACEWELRELDGYVATVLGEAGGASQGGRERNPLRPELLGHALVRGVEVVSDQADVRKRLLAELGRSLAALLRPAYAAIVADFRRAGVQPLGLQVRHRSSAPATEAAAGAAGDAESQRGGLPPEAGRNGEPRPSGRGGAPRTAFAPSTRGAGFAPRGGTPLGQVDPALMHLLRRLALSEPAPSTGSGGEFGGGPSPEAFDGGAPLLPNLIHRHREELRQASSGTLDHMVIDVIGFLFDQILADPKLPPQLARLIARLQLPVLRAALGDSSFFSSRKHPVRRFVNRIASLGAAFEDFDDASAHDFLAKVKALVGEVVDGDFDQLEVYEHKLRALEAYVAEQAQRGLQGDAARLLAEKEDQLRLRALYAERLSSDLRSLSGPAFVRDFIAGTWSQVLLRAAEAPAPEGGEGGPLVRKFRRTARELAMSVQPKTTPAHRKAFLAELPKLMQELSEGMNLIGWPEAERRAFFGQLMPAHAEALKAPPARPLDLNLLARQVEGALERPTPSREELKAAPASALPPLSEELVLPTLSADDAARIGLVAEQSVDWSGRVDIDLGAAPDAGEIAAAQGGAAQPVAPGLPGIAEAAEPVQGRELADAVQLGYPYQMLLHDQWQKVRLAHVSSGRSFFMFTHGGRHRKTVSLTYRMLQRLCESGRFRAYEQAALIERATERARRQLATLGAGVG